jgi:hypothetical protein
VLVAVAPRLMDGYSDSGGDEGERGCAQQWDSGVATRGRLHEQQSQGNPHYWNILALPGW